MRPDYNKVNAMFSMLSSCSPGGVCRWTFLALAAYAANGLAAEPAAPDDAPSPSATVSAPDERRLSTHPFDTLAERDYALPAWEIVGFDVLVNRVNRFAGSQRENYQVTLDSIRRNLHSSWGTDRDPFEINQLGHPYQGAMYHGFARSAYWQSLGYTFAGSTFLGQDQFGVIDWR